MYGQKVGSSASEGVSLEQLSSCVPIESDIETVKTGQNLTTLLQYFKTKDDNLLLLIVALFNHIIQHQIKVYDEAANEAQRQKLQFLEFDYQSEGPDSPVKIVAQLLDLFDHNSPIRVFTQQQIATLFANFARLEQKQDQLSTFLAQPLIKD